MASLRTIRRNQLLSQRDLARKANVTPSTIYLIESGKTRPRLKVMRQICEALEVDPREVEEFRETLDTEPQPVRQTVAARGRNVA
jgi:transcriptional regulator with XRE-family HTH domain